MNLISAMVARGWKSEAKTPTPACFRDLPTGVRVARQVFRRTKGVAIPQQTFFPTVYPALVRGYDREDGQFVVDDPLPTRLTAENGDTFDTF